MIFSREYTPFYLPHGPRDHRKILLRKLEETPEKEPSTEKKQQAYSPKKPEDSGR